MKKIVYLLFLFGLLFSCSKEKYFDGPDFYQDDFENYTKVEDMFLPYPDLDKFWSFTQITREGNYIFLDSTFSHYGNKSVKIYCQKSNGDVVSKCSINKQHMAFWENETVRISAWLYIEGSEKLDWLFLADLEEKTAIGAGPGLRLSLVNNQLVVEHKFNEDDIFQTKGAEIDFPRNQWVEIVWEIKLSKKKKGTVKLWQNGQLIIDAKNTKTLPKDFLYFQQGTKGIYGNVEFGATANSYDNDVILWIDDIKIEKVN
jgi:hypothetical protein